MPLIAGRDPLFSARRFYAELEQLRPAAAPWAVVRHSLVVKCGKCDRALADGMVGPWALQGRDPAFPDEPLAIMSFSVRRDPLIRDFPGDVEEWPVDDAGRLLRAPQFRFDCSKCGRRYQARALNMLRAALGALGSAQVPSGVRAMTRRNSLAAMLNNHPRAAALALAVHSGTAAPLYPSDGPGRRVTVTLGVDVG